MIRFGHVIRAITPILVVIWFLLKARPSCWRIILWNDHNAISFFFRTRKADHILSVLHKLTYSAHH
ncbi:MAG: hypothetical protein B6245_18110 [Desulfobacteraceae bacterium 4572_88]|nr:MAG: hypothetical protein B6245_18110 [Desulfobacteraceae bacterium 4572_88]RLC21300.1 MAG: hypothetical protein DRI57_02700 [Deltaproteobacteria bacterium]